MADNKFYGTGRRKSSVARVYLVPGTGKITINKKDIDAYLPLETLKVVVRQPLEATETTDKFDVLVNVKGGGLTGQAGAIRHGISRALLEVDADYRPVLKKAGFLTRDPRMKERNGGYTRVLKLGYRQGDAADVVILELVDYKLDTEDKEEKSKKSSKKAEGAEPKAKKTAKAKDASAEDKPKKTTSKKPAAKKADAETK